MNKCPHWTVEPFPPATSDDVTQFALLSAFLLIEGENTG
jgi:hypothetical protein